MAFDLRLLAAALVLLGAPLALEAQVPVDEDGNPIGAGVEELIIEQDGGQFTLMTAAELEELVGPVALYPDDLLAIVLPASTYPLEIVQAARFLEDLEQDGSLEPDESWDESVIALLNYPEVIRMLDRDIDWTWRLGEAVIAQQADVIAAVESFRDRAYAAGNLETDDRQVVSTDDGVIQIDPLEDDIIYVPYYEPEEVVVYQPRRVYHYYPHPYPVYYYPYPAGYHFDSGYFWGVTTAFTIGWPNRYLHVYHPSYWGHPYYGYHYYAHWYRHPGLNLYNSWYVHNAHYISPYRYRDGDYWRPRLTGGARPDARHVRNYNYPPGAEREDRNSRRGRTERDNRSAIDNRNRTGTASTSRRSGRDASDNRRRVNTDRARTSDRSTSRGIADSRSEIRFRDRTTADRANANRNRVTSNRDTRTSTNRTDRASSRRVDTSARRSSERSTTVRQPTSRPAVRQPAARPAERQSSQRPAVRNQAPRTSRPAAPVRQSAPPPNRASSGSRPQRQSAPPPNRASSGSRPQRQANSARASSRPRRPN